MNVKWGCLEMERMYSPLDAYLRKPQKEGAEKRSPDPGRMLEPGGMKKDQLTMET